MVDNQTGGRKKERKIIESKIASEAKLTIPKHLLPGCLLPV
jgi:hypothetical protein